MSLKATKTATAIYLSVINMERKMQNMINDFTMLVEDITQLRQELHKLEQENAILTDSDLEQIFDEFRDGIKNNFIPLVKHYRITENLGLREAKHKADDVWAKLAPKTSSTQSW